MTEPPRRRPASSVRTTVLAALVALVTLALGVAGATTYALQRSSTDERIDSALTRAVTDFRRSAGTTVEGGTVETLRRGLQETVPLPYEGMIGLVDGVPTWYAPRTVPVRLEDDPDLVRQVAGAPTDEARLSTVTTPRATYRVATVPVRVEGDPASGLYVIAADRDSELEALASAWRRYTLVAGAALVLITLAGWLVIGRVLRPLEHLRDTAQRINDTDLSDRIPVTGTDDIAELTRTVNAMLDRLETAFVHQRRLLDEVGHELRTPLTVIGGHLELMEPEDREDVVATRALALDEVDRMRLLVDDLLVLARADRPDFVRPVPAQVGVLVDDVLDKARGLGRREWRVGERADVECVLDPNRVTQAMLQLVSNAVRYSEEGSRVTIGSAVDGDLLRLWVRDEGQGIDADDVGRVLDRFVRGRAATESGTPGSGLGLAIVDAIATAHGGRVEIASTRGAGTTVVLEIPARAVPAPEDTLVLEVP
ncbi:HAMP domain-containing histidine kinase [Phycicoccus sp. BSK3Z-2]|uniref:histidine kinase n=1 Tax=Phycicoccus avicenniae TaxID=2828860 RepID=A0A941D945_9MICO|nr:HAMP domain-containing sensor histidine kinase [Phycicoccus avicenniae]MBR7743373.1 HAMP domain-containing histidine kinase [Phycicoccus avicenniae]